MFKSNSAVFLVVTFLLGCGSQENTLDIGNSKQQTNVTKKAELQENRQVIQPAPSPRAMEMNGVVALWASINDQKEINTINSAEPTNTKIEDAASANQSINEERDLPPPKVSPERNWQPPIAHLSPAHSGMSRSHENGQSKRPVIANRAGDTPGVRQGDTIQRQGLESLNR